MSKLELDTTTNRSVYNKCNKEQNASCSYCKWHSTFYKNSENDSQEQFYVEEPKRPNWKLVSKNRKQWMDKRFKFLQPIKTQYSDFTQIIW